MADEQRELRETAEDLQLAVRMVVRQMRVAASGGLSLSQVAVLKQLDHHGPATAAELARAERIRPQSMIATVNALRAAGYIERTADPTDGRRQIVALTESGIACVRECREAGYGRLAELLAERLTEAEHATLREAIGLLKRLAEG
ncbi:MarR family transcriptional regulator [Streptomyces sp. NBC_00536]|uniref:MarR family winged helix-turn-helix transcriptional regulator n=1 Tax=Streptomyces sp. NBC_00536 TaxID=2975769 RepID=UPI002E803B3A|nr:MarR family transcriptional regulator [Streptomyces sp. NBC_00536]WUC82398.1 MarR family transcriptional regulator [Streptomyces sp. NBC_00536]